MKSTKFLPICCNVRLLSTPSTKIVLFLWASIRSLASSSSIESPCAADRIASSNSANRERCCFSPRSRYFLRDLVRLESKYTDDQNFSRTHYRKVPVAGDSSCSRFVGQL